VVARVRDRSGNETATTIGVVEIETYQMSIEVQLQGLVPGPLTRDVTFVLSDSIGTIIETRTEPVTFTSGTGSVVLPGVAGTTAYISAKTAWNLRKRLEVGFDAAGHGIASFTGSNQLRGGDLTGSNTVGTIDYAILRNNFNQAGAAAQQADITGSGTVGTIDYAILRANFNTAGDPQ
jgi:hypothetical protein